MICNRCGGNNPDDALACRGCGHKLQSGVHHRPEPEADSGRMELLAPLKGPGPVARQRRRRCLEAWAVALLVAGGGYALLEAHLAWPVFPLAGLGAAYGWLRGIGWKD
ncbi:zinc ribbon domain-containing protein [Fundidesulfovibrio soli]|uniref:zinc ribbon domain-containing protein n=1 Tax=Fundidesulfovibrio soli TaxID=2922716 RepID=UPI001FAEAF78|nr:zinc ribbon domain-containing protein [Fundidesulfovibrio soli]